MKRGIVMIAGVAMMAGVQIGTAASASAGTCTVNGLQNGASAKCERNGYFTQYHVQVRCRVGDIANRFVMVNGPSRTAGGPNASVATCGSGNFWTGESWIVPE